MKVIFLSVFSLILGCNSIKEFEYISNSNDRKYKDFVSQHDANSYTNIVSKKGTFYLYKPCDLGFQQLIEINDNKIVIEAGETFEYQIKSVIHNNDIIDYEIYNDYEMGNLLMKTLDDNKVLFKLKDKDTISYFLMTSFSSATNYPLLIHHCNEKRAEMDFDSLDLERIWHHGFE